MMHDVVIVDAVRTPTGRYKGVLKDIRPDDLAATVIKALLSRSPELPPDTIDEVIFGNANGAGEENRNVARMALLLAGLPVTVGGTTVNRLCGSSLDAVSIAARGILSGELNIVIAGGTESMTRAPFVMKKPDKDFPRGNIEMLDTTIGWRFPNPKLAEMYGTDSMPETAENVARKFQITRADQDKFAFESQQKAKSAMAKHRFHDEIIPVKLHSKKDEADMVDTDEHPRPATTLEKLTALPPLFQSGTVTAGNASGINDGASALLMMNAEKAADFGLKPLVRFRGSAVAGVEPSIMGIGPVASTEKLLKRTNLKTRDIDLVELNEAFASQSLACITQLDMDMGKVNVNGGAIALGHPLGASGARILTTLIHELKKQNAGLGLAAMCIGVGQGISVLVENID